MKFIINADEPFRGVSRSILLEDGTVAYTNGMTLCEYEKDCGFKVQVVSDDELDKMCNEYYETLITNPTRIDVDKWNYALDVLPPSRYHTVRGWEVFHIVERLTGDLVAWYGRIGHSDEGARCYEWTDRSSISDQQIFDKLVAADKGRLA